MKNLILASAILCAFNGFSQETLSAKYDAGLAKELNADEYGMRNYILCILKTGAVQLADQAQTDKLFRGHLDNIEKMASSGQLVVAGPLKKNEKDYRGIFILNVKTTEEAMALLKNDPAISEGLLTPELYSWYGSAALPKYLPYHEKIQKKKP